MTAPLDSRFFFNFRGRSMNGNNHGGRRPGAGRKPGGQNQKSASAAARIVAEAEAAGKSLPLKVLLDVMWLHEQARRWDKAAAAVAAAPYVHPRKATVAVRDDSPPRKIVVEVRRAERID
jgi:hypothetical protein